MKDAPDPRKMYVHAERFRVTDHRLRDPRLIGIDVNMGSYIGAPSIVLSSFACELYLKCLLRLTGKPVPTTHNLKRLFHQLPTSTQRRLEAMWGEFVPTQANLVNVAQKLDYPIFDLRIVVGDAATAFEEMRYAYEGTLKGKYFLGDFPYVLRKLIMELKPEWKGLGPTPPQEGLPPVANASNQSPQPT